MLNVKNAYLLVNKLYAMSQTFTSMHQKTSVMPDKVEASKKYKEYAEVSQQCIAYITMIESYSKNAEFYELQNQVLTEALVEKQKQLNRYQAIHDLIANNELEAHVDRVKEVFNELTKEKI